jgi:hypothetical protein
MREFPRVRSSHTFLVPSISFCIWTLLLIGLLIFSPAAARAQETPLIRAKKTVVLNSVGDGRFTVEVKMPVFEYTQLKNGTPNMALLLRRIGLIHEELCEVQNIKGEFDDAESTLRLSWTGRGLARPQHDHVWEVPLEQDSRLESLSIRDNLALFSTSAYFPRVGVIPLVVQVEGARGSSDLRFLKSPNRLLFRMPSPAAAGGSRTAFDFDFQAKPQVMSCLAKSHGNPKFGKMWVARTVFKSTGDQAIASYRVRFRLREHAPSWSAWRQCSDVLPGQTVVDAYFPIFDLDKIGRLNGSCRDSLEVEYQYRRADGQLVEMTDSRTIQILGRNEAFLSSQKPEDWMSWYDATDCWPVILASFVTKDDAIIQQVAGWVSGQEPGGLPSSLSDAAALKFLQDLYAFIAYNRIAYQTPPEGKFNGQNGQHVKYGRDVLQNRAGTCVDLAILYGSVCEAVGLKPILYFIPGHCFPAIRLPKSGQIVPVESTFVGRHDFQAAAKRGLEEVKEAKKDGRYYEVDIQQMHDAGHYGLQLPALPASTLSDWGIRPLSADEARPAETPGRHALAVPAWAIGTWKCDSTVRQERVRMTIALRNDWSYTYSLHITDSSGDISEGSGEGTFQVGPRYLVFTPSSGKDKGTPIKRDYVSEGGYLWIKFREFEDYQLPFAKSKPEQATATTVAPANKPAPALTSTVVPASMSQRPPSTARVDDSDRGQRTGILPRVHRGRK